jgi:hypothetical protein
MLESLVIVLALIIEVEKVIGVATAVIGLISLLIPSWRKIIANLFARLKAGLSKERLAWQDRTTRQLEETTKSLIVSNDERAKFLEKYSKDSKRWNDSLEDINLIKRAIYNGGNGIEARVVKTEIAVTEQFIDLPYPAFQCNAAGDNIICSDAYIELVGAESSDDMNSRKWKDRVVSSHESEAYFIHFKDAAQRGDDFIGTCSFYDPLTSEYRGKYRIFMKAYPMSDERNKTMYRGRFIIALDEKAAELVDHYKWKMKKAAFLEKNPDNV